MGKNKTGDLGKSVKQFNGTFYLQWKQDVEMYLRANGLSYLLSPIPPPYIPQSITPPPSPSDTNMAPSSSAPGKATDTSSINISQITLEFQKKLEEWREVEIQERRKEEKAAKKRDDWKEENEQLVGALYFVIGLKYRSVIKNIHTIMEVFKIMDDMFLREDKMRKLEVKEQYNTFRFDEINRDINAQFVRYEEVMDKCVELGIVIADNADKYEYLYMALPQTYKGFLSTYQQVQKEETLTYLVAKKLVINRWERDNVERDMEKKGRQPYHQSHQQDRRGGEKKEKPQQEKALMVQENPPQKKVNFESQKKFVCENCKKEGHWASQCKEPLTPAGIASINKWRQEHKDDPPKPKSNQNRRWRGAKAHYARRNEEEEEEPELGVNPQGQSGASSATTPKVRALLALGMYPSSSIGQVCGTLEANHPPTSEDRGSTGRESFSQSPPSPVKFRPSFPKVPVNPGFSRITIVPEVPGIAEIFARAKPDEPGNTRDVFEVGDTGISSDSRRWAAETPNVRVDTLKFHGFFPGKGQDVVLEMEMDGGLECGSPDIGNLVTEVNSQLPQSPIKLNLSSHLNSTLNCPVPMSSICLYKNEKVGTGLVLGVNTMSHVGFVESDPAKPSLYTVMEGSEGGEQGGHEFDIPRARLGKAVTCLNEKTYPQQESMMQSSVVVWDGDVVNHLAPERETVIVEDNLNLNKVDYCFVSPKPLHIDDFEFAPRDRAPVKATISPNLSLSIPQQIYYAEENEGGVVLDTSFDWVLDTGATAHMCNNKAQFTTFTSCVSSVDGLGSAKSYGHGICEISILLKGKQETVTLSNTLFVPDLPVNLISLSTLDAKGFYFDTENQPIVVERSTQEIVLEGTRGGGLYILNRPAQPIPNDKAFPVVENLKLWHERLGHIGSTRLKQMAAGAAEGITIKGEQGAIDCDVCTLGKAQRSPIHNYQVERATAPGETIHWDTCGPMDVPTHHKKKYVVLGVDDYTRQCFVNFVERKSDADEAIRLTIQSVENQFGVGTVKRIHSDGGGEFISNELTSYLLSKGIRITTCAPDTPEHNGVAERKLKSIISNARCMLIHSGLPKTFWAEATRYAGIIENASPTKANDNVSPYELWHKKKPDVSTFRTFGSAAMVLNHKHKPKFSVRTKEAIYLGPALGGDGHRLYNPTTGKFFCSRDVYFREGLDKPKSPVLQDDSSSEGETDTDSSDQSTEEESTDDSDDPDYGNEWEMPTITSIELREKYH